MVRPFDLRDVVLVARLASSGVPLCNELALVHGVQPVRAALAGYLLRGAHTHVALEADAAGFVQMQPRGEHGVLTYISADSGPLQGVLLDGVARAAGELGLHQLLAEAPVDDAWIGVLRQAGFALYLRQDILRLAQAVQPAAYQAGSLPIRAAAPLDEWAVQQLYHNTVPRLAQLAETIPCAARSRAVRGYVLAEAGEAMAYLEVRGGPAGVWFNVLVHPQAEACAQHVLGYGLSLLGERRRQPVYCCVRRYQEWLWEPLLALGFEPFVSSSVLVKRLVAPLAEPESKRVPALEPQARIRPVARVTPLIR